jgi:hypothetical protein
VLEAGSRLARHERCVRVVPAEPCGARPHLRLAAGRVARMLSTRARTILAASVGAALLVPSGAHAGGTPCGSVTKGDWRASDIRATHLTCASARRKLRRWLPPPLPRNEFGWYCYRMRDRRQCVAGNGDAPRFSFRLKRREVVPIGDDTCPSLQCRQGGRPRQAQIAQRLQRAQGSIANSPSGTVTS